MLIESVQETITDVLGASVIPAIWYHYQVFFSITRDKIPYRLDALFSSLKKTFGIGGETLGRIIIKKLYAKAEVPLNYVPQRPFTDYVEELKQILAKDHMQP